MAQPLAARKVALVFLTSDAVQAELVKVMDAHGNSLEVKRKHWCIKRGEGRRGTPITSVVIASRNGILRSYQSSRTRAIVSDSAAVQIASKERFMNARALAIKDCLDCIVVVTAASIGRSTTPLQPEGFLGKVMRIVSKNTCASIETRLLREQPL